jgi:geranylgeranyl transferase type-2 subunit alpha
MHNRKKPTAPPTDAEVSALKEKTSMYRTLVDMVLTKKREKDSSQETLVLVGKLLKLNPDFYSLWNMRKEILLIQYPQLNDASVQHKVELNEVRELELQISADGIRRNPKACKIIMK